MVFIELKSDYLQNLSASGFSKVVNYLFRENIEDSGSSINNSVNKSLSDIITALEHADHKSFSTIVESYKRKQPDINSPWLYNNFLIFFLFIGLEKFRLDKGWLRNALAIRKYHGSEGQLVSDLFSALSMNSEIQSGPLAPLQLAAYFLVDPKKISQNNISEAVRSFAQMIKFPAFEDALLNLLYLSSFEKTLLLKDIENIEEKEALAKFKAKFDGRLSRISTMLVYFIFLFVMVCGYFFTQKVFLTYSDNLKTTIITVLGLLGITGMELFKLKKNLRFWIELKLKSFLGFDLLSVSSSEKKSY